MDGTVTDAFVGIYSASSFQKKSDMFLLNHFCWKKEKYWHY